MICLDVLFYTQHTLTSCAPPFQDGDTPLLVAAREGNYSVIELLLNYNASIDKGDFVRALARAIMVDQYVMLVCKLYDSHF